MLWPKSQASAVTYQRFGLQHKTIFILSPEMTLKLSSGADSGCIRHCNTIPVDLEGSRGQVLVVLDGFWKFLGGGCVGGGGGKAMFHCGQMAAAVMLEP